MPIDDVFELYCPKCGVLTDTGGCVKCGISTLFREIGIDTEMTPDSTDETIFFVGLAGGGLDTRFANATPKAVENFCEYWRHQIDLAQAYVENGCDPRVSGWSPVKPALGLSLRAVRSTSWAFANRPDIPVTIYEVDSSKEYFPLWVTIPADPNEGPQVPHGVLKPIWPQVDEADKELDERGCLTWKVIAKYLLATLESHKTNGFDVYEASDYADDKPLYATVVIIHGPDGFVGRTITIAPIPFDTETMEITVPMSWVLPGLD